jgi:hypothetical protein
MPVAACAALVPPSRVSVLGKRSFLASVVWAVVCLCVLYHTEGCRSGIRANIVGLERKLLRHCTTTTTTTAAAAEAWGSLGGEHVVCCRLAEAHI